MSWFSKKSDSSGETPKTPETIDLNAKMDELQKAAEELENLQAAHNAGAADAEDDKDFIEKLLAEPRGSRHHYEIAHCALREMCFADPLYFFSMIYNDENRDDFLQRIWEIVCEQCDHTGPAPFDITDLGLTSGRVKGLSSIIVSMPPPARTGEAYFVGISLAMQLDEDEQPKDVNVTYLTLEKGKEMDGSDCTVLCAWEGEEHLNHGNGPEPTLEAFVGAMEEMIER
jgi:hypothetical protein